jgi:hypothetical protein
MKWYAFFKRIIENSVIGINYEFGIPHVSVRHRCATNFVDLLHKYEAIFKKALTRVSEA